jgi:hypothetical protein
MNLELCFKLCYLTQSVDIVGQLHHVAVVPLHATKAIRGRGGIASTHSRPRHWIVVSGQRHAPAAL